MECGFPIYNYHHIDDYAVVLCHEARNITLLCERHHGEATRGLLPRAAVIKADSAPFNISRSTTTPYLLRFGAETCRIDIGNNSMVTQPGTRGCHAIVIDATSFLSFLYEDGNLLLSLALLDEQGRERMVIKENEMTCSASQWDVSFEGKTLTIRDSLKKDGLRLEVEFHPPDRIRVVRGVFYYHSHNVSIQSDGQVIANGAVSHSKCSLVVCEEIGVGLSIKSSTPETPGISIEFGGLAS